MSTQVEVMIAATTQLHNVPSILREIASQVERKGCTGGTSAGSGTYVNWEVKQIPAFIANQPQTPITEEQPLLKHWPLPSDWACIIPPQAVTVTHDAAKGITKPDWNPQWLRGLEQFIRSIVRDERKKS